MATTMKEGAEAMFLDSSIPILISIRDVLMTLDNMNEVKRITYALHISPSWCPTERLYTLNSKLDSNILFDDCTISLPPLNSPIWSVNGRHPMHCYLIVTVSKSSDTSSEIAYARIPIAHSIQTGSDMSRKYKLYPALTNEESTIKWEEENIFIAMTTYCNYPILYHSNFGDDHIILNTNPTYLSELFDTATSLLDPVIQGNHPDQNIVYLQHSKSMKRLNSDVVKDKLSAVSKKYTSYFAEIVLDVRTDCELINLKKLSYKAKVESVKLDSEFVIKGRIIVTNLRLLFIPYATPLEGIVLRLFDVLDKDASGKINPQELEQALMEVVEMESTGNSDSGYDILQVFKDLDKDGNGEVSIQEVLHSLVTNLRENYMYYQDTVISLPLWNIANIDDTADVPSGVKGANKNGFSHLYDVNFDVEITKYHNLHDEANKPYVAYELFIYAEVHSWSVHRRFHDFYDLQNQLQNFMNKDTLPMLPPKDSVGNLFSFHSSPQYLDQRKGLLDAYMQKLVEIPAIWALDCFLKFIDNTTDCDNLRRVDECFAVTKEGMLENYINGTSMLGHGASDLINRLNNISAIAQRIPVNGDASRTAPQKHHQVHIQTKDCRRISFQINKFSESQMMTAVYGALYRRGICGDNLTNIAWCKRLKEEVIWRNRADLYSLDFAIAMYKYQLQCDSVKEEQPALTTATESNIFSITSTSSTRAGIFIKRASTKVLIKDTVISTISNSVDAVEQKLVSGICDEYVRMKLPNATWRISTANNDYELCSSYPKSLIVPANSDDEALLSDARERSKSRIPVLTWIHPDNGTPLCRSSQPNSGLFGKTLTSDEVHLLNIKATIIQPDKYTLRIVDARPKLNARANSLLGKGFESTERLGKSRIHFCNIENIHDMKLSLQKYQDAINTVDSSTYLSQLENSKWLHHLVKVIQASYFIAHSIDFGDPVLVHCSDGWDRTSQLSALSQLLLDPHYRTIRGFASLIEKDFCAFGHMFDKRTGQGVEERSPIFLQFIDAVYQLTRQFPTSFEFNELYLLVIADAAYSRLFANFLGNTECNRFNRLMILADEFAEEIGRTDGLNMISCIDLWNFLDESYDAAIFTNLLYAPPILGSRHTTLLRPIIDERCMHVWEAYYCRNGQYLYKNYQSLNENELLKIGLRVSSEE